MQGRAARPKKVSSERGGKACRTKKTRRGGKNKVSNYGGKIALDIGGWRGRGFKLKKGK